MNYNLLAYATLIIYILIVGMKRFKHKKILTTVTCIISTVVCLTIGARIVWFFYGTHSVEELFAFRLSGFKIFGALIGGLVRNDYIYGYI